MKWIVIATIVLPALVAYYGTFYQAVAAGMVTIVTLCILETRRE